MQNMKTINDNIRQLAQSDRGRAALSQLQRWADDPAGGLLGLDEVNQDALIGLIYGIWAKPGSARDLLRMEVSTHQ